MQVFLDVMRKIVEFGKIGMSIIFIFIIFVFKIKTRKLAKENKIN